MGGVLMAKRLVMKPMEAKGTNFVGDTNCFRFNIILIQRIKRNAREN